MIPKIKRGLIMLFGVGLIVSPSLLAQQTTSGSGGQSWGSYSWQVDQTNATTTLISVLNITNVSSQPTTQFIPANLSGPTTIHGFQGNLTLTAVQGTTCSPIAVKGPGGADNFSFVLEVKDQPTGNVIAAVKMQKFAPGIANVPINGNFPNGLSITNLQIQFFVDECGGQIDLALMMN